MKPTVQSIRPLGTLEEKVMQVIWSSGQLSVREVNQRLGLDSLAHTTVMTTMDRLYKKGLLKRTKDGVAYVYSAALSRDKYRQMLVESTISGLMAGGRSTVPVLAAFVDAAAELDEENLARLEALIAQRKRSGD